MEKLFVGREREMALLNEYLSSDQSEFVAVYGRRRIGKTFLIQQVIGNDYAFYASGMNQVNMRMQIDNFTAPIRKINPKLPVAKSWLDAFMYLENYLDALPDGRKVVFIDEMPWLDTPRSNFISGLEHFWNSWASWRNDIKLIVCGSATSWIINNLIKNRGGLHNRITHKIALKPFTLRECRLYLDAKGFRFPAKQIAECYMVFGGVPFYLSKLNKGESLAQNIDRLLFAEDGELADEFHSLYNSLYKNAQPHIKVVTALAQKGKGLTRKDILQKTKIADNGKFSMVLDELENCGFIRFYEPFVAENKRIRRSVLDRRQSTDTLYQLIDPFTLYYFQVMAYARSKDPHYWSNTQNSHEHSTWSGLAFEMLCLNHFEQIKSALGISGVVANAFSWFGTVDGKSSQIDLVIDRSDNSVNLCEMKFHQSQYTVSQVDEDDWNNKIETFRTSTGTDKDLILTLITTKGIVRNEHSYCVQRELLLDDLFV